MVITSSDKGSGLYIVVQNSRGQRVIEYGPYPEHGTIGMQSTFANINAIIPSHYKLSWVIRGQG